jgi:SAM-dependent methyltransferase
MCSMLYNAPWPRPKFEDCYWYHSLDLPDGRTVHGQWDLRGRFADYTSHAAMAGKRVLDVGTASGFLTWEAERAGADVVSFDLDHARRQRLLPFRDQEYFYDRAESERKREVFFNGMKSSYWYMHHALRSRALVHYGDSENLPRELGHFDLALLCSVVEHLPDHIQTIASVAALADTIVMTGPVTDTDALVADFAGRRANPTANFSFWRYSLGTYREIFGMVGFGINRVTRGKYRCLLDNSDVELPTIVACRSK